MFNIILIVKFLSSVLRKFSEHDENLHARAGYL